MSALLELAERCENAEGSDRELDFFVHGAVKGWPIERTGNEFYARIDGKRYMVGWLGNEVKSTYYEVRTDSGAPLYTASLDAARLLVPSGEAWRVEDHPDYGISAVVADTQVFADQPALALCAAALKVRAHAGELA